MLPALSVCVMLLPILSVPTVTGYNTKGHFYEGPVFPMVPAQPQILSPQMIYPEIPSVFPMYQNEAPFLQAPPMWPNMHQAPFFHPRNCDMDLPFHQNMHFLGSPFMNQNQWKKNSLQGQGQGQGQWKQTTFQNQGNGQWGQTPFPKQDQSQWKQPASWNTNQNVNMIGQWGGFPVNDQMLSRPAVSGLAPKKTEIKSGLFEQSPLGSQTFNSPGFDAGLPIQSRRLR